MLLHAPYVTKTRKLAKTWRIGSDLPNLPNFFTIWYSIFQDGFENSAQISYHKNFVIILSLMYNWKGVAPKVRQGQVRL